MEVRGEAVAGGPDAVAEAPGSVAERHPKKDEPWLEEGYERNNPRVLDYSFFHRCPRHQLPLWVAQDPERGWICLPCNSQAQVSHCASEKHAQKVLRAATDYDWYVWHLQETGLHDLALETERI